jgi:hypothetical protein
MNEAVCKDKCARYQTCNWWKLDYDYCALFTPIDKGKAPNRLEGQTMLFPIEKVKEQKKYVSKDTIFIEKALEKVNESLYLVLQFSPNPGNQPLQSIIDGLREFLWMNEVDENGKPVHSGEKWKGTR